MNGTMNRRILLSAAAIGMLFVPARQAAGQVVVIVNSANAVTSLSQDDVKVRFLKTSPSWDGGEKVRPVDQIGNTTEREVFLSEVLGLSPSELERYWIEKQYANATEPPAKAPDDATVIRLVTFLEGGIGFISKAAYDAADHSKIKAVLMVGP